MVTSSGRTGIGVVAGATLVFALAYFSPVSMTDADPAMTLVASQSLVERGTLRLDGYLPAALPGARLAEDYRLRLYDGAVYPNLMGPALISAPVVWIANRMGLDMRDPRSGEAAQNFVSAVSCSLLFVLLFFLCRRLAGAAAGLVIALVSVFGTSIISTGATALWGSNYALIFTTLALVHVASRGAERAGRVSLMYLALLVGAGFISRPATGLFGIACLVYLVGDANRRVAWSAGALLVAAVIVVAVPPLVLPWPWMLGHYAPFRLRPATSPGVGFYGVLLSPSRGLFVFSPFLLLVAAGTIRYGRILARDRLFVLAVTWIVLHTVVVATAAGKWWGGHSFGPRLMVDIVPGLAVLTCLAWAEVRRRHDAAVRGRTAAAYGALAVAAIAIHAGSGLFNTSAVAWNRAPDIDTDARLALDWQHPQFLATRARLRERLDAFERRDLAARQQALAGYVPGDRVAFDSAEALFLGWYAPEDGWRWSRTERPAIQLKLPAAGVSSGHLLYLRLGSNGRQRVDIHVNGSEVATIAIESFAAVGHLVFLPAPTVRGGTINTIELAVSDPRPSENDRRSLGVALRELRLAPMPAAVAEVGYRDDMYFGEGFGEAEAGWRWTDGARAVVQYPVGAVSPGGEYQLTLHAGTIGTQRVQVAVNGASIGEATVTEFAPSTLSLPVPAGRLTPHSVNRIVFVLPDARPAPGDPRQLGLAVVGLRLGPAPRSSGAR